MTDIYIVRHCEITSNESATFAGMTDCDITERGQKQLDALSERFKEVKLDKIYATSRIRAKKTANAMNRYSGAPIETDDGFMEIYLGELEGKPVSSLTGERRYNWFNALHLFDAPGGESMDDVLKRAWVSLIKVVEENDGKTVGISCHGGAIINITQKLLGLPREELGNVGWADNTAVCHVVFDGPDKWELLYENDSSHLTDDIRSAPVSSWK